MWVTDISYRNKRLINSVSRKHPVFLGSVMTHFTKDKPRLEDSRWNFSPRTQKHYSTTESFGVCPTFDAER